MFETYQRKIEAWAIQYGMRYMFKEEFLLRYVQEGWYTAHWYAGTGITEEQFMHDKEVLYGVIMSSNKDDPAANKYISMYKKPADGLAMWYCFMQDDGGLDNLIRKKQAINLELLQPFVSKYKGGLLAFLDNIESSWVHLENLDSNETISEDKKIHFIDGKSANTAYSTFSINAMEFPGGDMLTGYLKHMHDYIKHGDDNHTLHSHWHTNMVETTCNEEEMSQ